MLFRSVVKKDSSIVKYIALPADIEVERAQLALDYAKEELKDKEGKYKRCLYLTEKNSNTKESCENSKLDYEVALGAVADYQSKLDLANERKAKTIIKAPYDCRVSKVLLVQGSGTNYGTPILEIEKL